MLRARGKPGKLTARIPSVATSSGNPALHTSQAICQTAGSSHAGLPSEPHPWVQG